MWRLPVAGATRPRPREQRPGRSAEIEEVQPPAEPPGPSRRTLSFDADAPARPRWLGFAPTRAFWRHPAVLRSAFVHDLALLAVCGMTTSVGAVALLAWWAVGRVQFPDPWLFLAVLAGDLFLVAGSTERLVRRALTARRSAVADR